MLEKLLEGNMQIKESTNNWEEAIKTASIPLLEKKIIEERYIDAMINSVKDLGFYIILREHVAMPHARPEEGSLETGVSLLKLKKPVKFGNEEIYLIFVLASKDTNSHMEILKKLVELFQDDESIEMLKEADTLPEIEHIISKI